MGARRRTSYYCSSPAAENPTSGTLTCTCEFGALSIAGLPGSHRPRSSGLVPLHPQQGPSQAPSGVTSPWIPPPHAGTAWHVSSQVTGETWERRDACAVERGLPVLNIHPPETRKRARTKPFAVGSPGDLGLFVTWCHHFRQTRASPVHSLQTTDCEELLVPEPTATPPPPPHSAQGLGGGSL